MKLRRILKQSLGVCFDFDGSKFVSSGDLLFVNNFIHKLSRYEVIQLRKCQRGVFQNHGVCGQVFPFLPSPSLPIPSVSVAIAPIFAPPKSEKCLERTETLATQATTPATIRIYSATCSWENPSLKSQFNSQIRLETVSGFTIIKFSFCEV